MSLTCRYRDNLIHNTRRVVNGDAVEPVSLQEVKDWLNITYSDDDARLTALIGQCRDGVEMYCHISMVSKTITLDADLFRETELPYGPVASITNVMLRNGSTYEAQTGYVTTGDAGSYWLFQPAAGGRYKIVYTTPNMDMSEYGSLKLDLLRVIAYCFENRGDQPLTSLQGGMARPKGLDQALELFAKQYIRMTWL